MPTKTKLCQIIAVANGSKNRAQKEITRLHKLSQKPDLLTGISRTYTPKEEDGDKLPSESKRVQVTATDAIAEAGKIWTTLFDVVATQDTANCSAKADIKVGDTVVLEQVPVTHLLFLEKQLIDVHTFIEKIPTLDSAHDWTYDSNKGTHKTKPVEQIRTKKITKPVVLYEATDKHPAQVELVSDDITAGTWATVHFSGMLPADEKRTMLNKVVQLQEAVKFAREEANSSPAEKVEVGAKLFDFITTK